MDVQKKKNFKEILTCFLIFLAIHIVEEFLIIPKYSDTMGLVSCAGGFLALLCFIRFKNMPLERIGMPFLGHKISKGFWLAFALNIVPMIAVYSAEMIRCRSFGGSVNLTVYYDSIERAYSIAGRNTFVFWMAMGLIISLIHSVFYEMFFRGVLISISSKTLSFTKTNILQTLLYMIWFLVPVARVFMFRFHQLPTNRLLVFLAFTVVYEVLTAVKLGLMRYSTGAIWVCIWDHWAFAFITDVIHIQYSGIVTSSTDAFYYYRLVAYQAVSLIIAVFYYSQKRQKIEEQKQEAMIQNQ